MYPNAAIKKALQGMWRIRGNADKVCCYLNLSGYSKKICMTSHQISFGKDKNTNRTYPIFCKK
jgi:hypothetical protein